MEVRYTANGGSSKRAYKVRGLTTLAADEAKFDNEKEGTRMTVAHYYQQAYGIRCVPLHCVLLLAMHHLQSLKMRCSPIELVP